MFRHRTVDITTPLQPGRHVCKRLDTQTHLRSLKAPRGANSPAATSGTSYTSAEQRSAGEPSTSAPTQPAARPSKSLRKEADVEKAKICDRLIALFQEKPVKEWRQLMAFSKQWPMLRKSVMDRIQKRAQQDPSSSIELRRLGRKLQAVHEELTDYVDKIEIFLKAPESDWEALVLKHQTSLTSEFFYHIGRLVQACAEDVRRKEMLVNLANRLLTLLNAVTNMQADGGAMSQAKSSFDHLLQAESMEDVDRRLDGLAQSGRLDPAFMLTMSNAYANTKLTDATKEEVKDIMYYMYQQARKRYAQEQPKDIRILKHLVSLDDPTEIRDALEKAFTPGPELATPDMDYLSTTPQNFLRSLEAVLDSYDGAMRGDKTMREVGSLMDPRVIDRMRQIMDMVYANFM